MEVKIITYFLLEFITLPARDETAVAGLNNVDSRNKLSYNLLNKFEEVLGAPPVIRIGGDTGDAVQYNPHNNLTITNVFKPNDLEAVNVTFGSGLFQVLNENVPENQTYIFKLNLGQDNVQYPLEEVRATEAHLNGSKLYAYELVDWLSQIKREINNASHGFQIGALAVEPVEQGNFSLAEINSLGVRELVGNVKSESDHTYPYSNCPASLPALMSHLHTIEYFSRWVPSIAAAASINASFVMGETGSVSCHGAANISNTLGAAL
ncbi:MAG: hypothetical protein Q9165_002739 [Trypethelium subeluteriae]